MSGDLAQRLNVQNRPSRLSGDVAGGETKQRRKMADDDARPGPSSEKRRRTETKQGEVLTAEQVIQMLDDPDFEGRDEYMSDDSLDLDDDTDETSTLIDRTADVDIAQLLRRQAEREKRAEIETQYEADNDTDSDNDLDQQPNTSHSDSDTEHDLDLDLHEVRNENTRGRGGSRGSGRGRGVRGTW